MKKPHIITLMIAAVVVFCLLAWWAFKSSNAVLPAANVVHSNTNSSAVANNEQANPTTMNAVNANVAAQTFPAQAVVTTEDAAIRYAERNTEVVAFKKHAKQQDITIRSYAIYNAGSELWTVVFDGINAYDFAIQVRLTTDGTVTEVRGEGG